MKQLKRAVVVLLIVALALTTIACSTTAPPASSTPPASTPASSKAPASSTAPPASAAPAEKVALNLWHIHTQDTRKIPIEEGIRRFEADNPGVSVEITILENDPYKTKLRTVMGSGDAPDLFHSWGGGWLKAFVDEGLVVDITDAIKGWSSQLNEAAIGMNTFNGKVWGSPIINSATPLYYNKALFEKYNVKLPTTMAELEIAAETFKANGIIPFALANLTKWPGAQHFVMLSMRIGGPDIFQKAINGEVSFEDPAFIQAGEMLQSMVDKGWFPDGANALNWDTGDSRQMFYAEQCAMIVQTSGFVSTCKNENEDFFNNKFGIWSYPAVEGGKGKQSDVLAGENAFSISSSCKNPDVAIKLLEFLSTDDGVQQGLANGGTVGAKKGLTAPTAPLQDVMTMISDATYLQNYIDQTLSPELGELHKDTCQALFGKTMTSAQAAAEMQKLYDSLK